MASHVIHYIKKFSYLCAYLFWDLLNLLSSTEAYKLVTPGVVLKNFKTKF
jgi:hypothetical protein